MRVGRLTVTVAAILVVVGGTAAYVVTAATDANEPVAGSEHVSQAKTGDLLFVDLAGGQNRVEKLAEGGARTQTELACQRFYVAGDSRVCLKLSGPGPSYAAEISRAGQQVKSVALPGIPSRAKVSRSGNVVSWTSFVTGDSYSVPGGFSTRTGFYDVRTGESVESLEHFAATVEGSPLTARDINYWGLTVGSDDRTFYATLASGGFTWLVKGDLVAKTVTSLRRDAECPSLSPDGTKVAYKKRIGRLGPWDLAVLDLASGTEKRLPGTAGIDDQATWLNSNELAFAAVPKNAKLPAVHVVPADGSQPATVLIPDATSPSPVM
ncbi:TolB family protein [Lentzea sp. NPDC051213]|uniref:TolB family protein n=1 Tax=Lentzea sp. NPDC051213 TaxID=3364126 RepID=UPI003791B100